MTQQTFETAVELIDHYTPEVNQMISNIAEEFGIGIAMTVSSNLAIGMLHGMLEACKDDDRRVEAFVAITQSLLSGVSDKVLDATIDILVSDGSLKKH